MTFLEEMAAVAAELCAEFGELVTITWPDGATWSGMAAVLPVSRRYVDGVAVLATDRFVIVPGAGPPPLAKKPEATGLVTIAGEQVRIKDATEYRAQGGAAAYSLLAEGAA